MAWGGGWAESLRAGQPDPVSDLIREAYEAYHRKDLGQAAGGLREALRLLEAQAPEPAVFPDIPGWEVEKSEKSEAPGVGGSLLERRYRSEERSLRAHVVIDSPLVSRLAPLLASAQLARFAGYEVREISGREALIKGDKSRRELNLCLANGVLLRLEGKKVSEKQLLAAAERFDLAALEKLRP